MLDWKQDPHRRFNPLTREWVLVSPHRTERPWQGEIEKTTTANSPEYDPQCYLCPGNARAGGVRNPDYKSTFVFDNDFAALRPDTSLDRFERGALLVAEAEPGVCRVVCFTPKHNLTMANMEIGALRLVVDTWAEQFSQLGARPVLDYVQIFENRGSMMGASNPHPHCQIWANHSIPNEVVKEQASQRAWREERRACLLCDYLRLECSVRERVVDENESFLALVPFWAVWPFEIMLLAKRHTADIVQLTGPERTHLAEILHAVTARYDRLFQTPFPYSFGFHQRPTDGYPHDEWHLHGHFYPPLLRSATVRKFLVGYEMLAGPQRDLTAETAAERLRQA